jgi:hypothetical protein
MSKEHFIPDKRIRILSEENPEGISASNIDSKTNHD